MASRLQTTSVDLNKCFFIFIFLKATSATDINSSAKVLYNLEPTYSYHQAPESELIDMQQPF